MDRRRQGRSTSGTDMAMVLSGATLTDPLAPVKLTPSARRDPMTEAKEKTAPPNGEVLMLSSGRKRPVGPRLLRPCGIDTPLRTLQRVLTPHPLARGAAEPCDGTWR